MGVYHPTGNERSVLLDPKAVNSLKKAKKINLVSVLLAAVTLASLVAKVKWSYGFHDGR